VKPAKIFRFIVRLFGPIALSILSHNGFGQDFFPGLLDTNFSPPAISGRVYAIKSHHDGKVIVGGDYETSSPPDRYSLARLNGDGTLDGSFSPPFGDSSVVNALLVQADGKVFVAGDLFIQGQTRYPFVRLQPNGSLDLAVPRTGNEVGYATALDQSNRVMVAGGSFVGLNRLFYVRRLNGNGTTDTNFNTGTGANEPVNALAVQPDGKIIVAGAFTNFNGSPRMGVARLNSDGSVDSTFELRDSPDGTVLALALQEDGRLIIGGSFTNVGTTLRPGVARFNTNGTLDETFNPRTGAERAVFALALDDSDRVLIGGTFTAVGGLPRPGIARLHPDGRPDFGFRAHPSTGPIPNVIYSISFDEHGKVLVGGHFWLMDDVSRYGAARLYGGDGDLEPATIFTTSSNHTVNAGQSRTLRTQIWSSTPVSYEWLHNGVVLAGATNDTLVLSAIHTNQAGVYAVAVRNVYGVTTGQIANVEVTGLPARLLTQPTNVTVFVGQTASFSVMATGLPPPRLLWLKDGNVIAETTNGFLSFTNVQLANAGAYQVIASNYVGTATSQTAQLTIHPAPTYPHSTDVSFYLDPLVGGIVNAVACQADGRILAGGLLSRSGRLGQSGIVRFERNGDLDMAFAGGTNAYRFVNVVSVDAENRVIIAGDFHIVDGAPFEGIARLTSDGALDETFQPTFGTGGRINAIAPLADGKMIVARSVTGIDQLNIARLNADGTVDGGFQARVQGDVSKIAVQADGKIVLGGLFSRVNGVPRTNLARVNANGSVDESFDPQMAVDSSTVIIALAVQSNQKILIAGRFTPSEAVARHSLIRLNSDGTLDQTLDAGTGADDDIYAMALQGDGKIVLGGEFTSFNGKQRLRLVRLFSNGALDAGFQFLPNSGADGRIRSISLTSEGEIVVGGDFTIINGVPRRRVARLYGGNLPLEPPLIFMQPTNQVLKAGQTAFFSVGFASVDAPALTWLLDGRALANATNETLVLQNVQAAAAGAYSVVISNSFGATTSSIASLAVEAPTTTPGSLDTRFYAESLLETTGVWTMAMQANGKLVVARDPAAGRTGQMLIRVNSEGVEDAEFNAATSNTLVLALATTENDGVFAAGERFIKRLKADGTEDETFQASVNLPIYALDRQDDKLLIAGAFTQVNGLSRARVARLNSDGNIDTNFNAGLGPDGAVTDLARGTDGRIIIAGFFTNVNGVLRRGIARLNSDGSLDASFNARSPTNVVSVAKQGDGKLLIGFSSQFQDTNMPVMVRLLDDGTEDSSFNSTIHGGRVNAIIPQPDGRIFIGGTFTSVGGIPRPRIARLNEDGSLDVTFDPGGGIQDTSVYNLPAVQVAILDRTGKIIVGGRFTHYNLVPRNGLARVYGDPFITARRSEGSFSILVPTDVGHDYYLEYKDSLGEADWTAFPAVTGDGSVKEFKHSVPGVARRFYRLRVETQ
jgi:uncharacterized delta-60 repeat protein